jgi:hypothetical protein
MSRYQDIPVVEEVHYLGSSKDSDVEFVIDTLPERLYSHPRITRPIIVERVTKSYTIPPSPDLSDLKKERKRKRCRAGSLGCLAGMLIGGPVGAVLIGLGAAVVSDRRNRKKELKILREYRMKVKQQASVAITLESCTAYNDIEQ